MPLLFALRLPRSMGFCGSRLHPPVVRTDLPTTRLLFSTNLRKAPPRTIIFALNPPGIRSPHRTSFTRDVHLAPLADVPNTSKRIELLEAKLKEAGIHCDQYAPGQHSSLFCPKCRGGKEQERSFSLFIREDGLAAAWRCHRGKCGWSGGVQDGKVRNQSLKGKQCRVITEEELQLEPPCKEILQYLKERGITAETIRRNAIMQRKYMDQTAIAFAYRRNGVLVNCKYRAPPKKFWQEQDTERVFYGLDDIKNAKDIIIVEGEIDKLSMEEAGYRNCVSVPCGAPSKVSEVVPEEEKASRVILATDADGPGQALAEEIARRLGKERCWRVQWPVKSDTEFCKDANEVLMYKGKDALKEVIENAELYPIRGLFNFSNFFREIDEYYHCRNGYERGVSTGWKVLNELYNVVPGELTVISGVPNSGKSEWIDALLCNINENEGWTFALCSMENKVREHARKLLEKHIKKPFFNAGYGGSAERMNVEELKHGKEWLNNTFHLIRCEDDCLPSIDWVLSLAKAAVLRHGVRGLVIDPYNELDHQRPPNQTETEYVSQILTKIKRFAQHHSCHVWFVAHPRQLQQWNGDPPNLYDISGSAHFINKCDNGVVIHRNRDQKIGPLDRVQVCVRKVRNKVVGKIGEAFLSYDRITGQFFDVEDGSQSR